MSAGDFQTKYASVMESMLKSAVAETTKLFETMVDELKAEISRIKKENEDLKSRCSRVESARSRPTDGAGSEPPPGPNDGSEKRDTATQCDLVPFHMMLVEQCQPLRHSSLHNQKQLSNYKGLEYILQDHNYDTHREGDSQIGPLLVKQESVLKEEETESTVVSGQALSDKEDSLWASGTDNEGPLITKVCSTREIPLPQRHGDTQLALEPCLLGTYSSLQGGQNQSSEPEHSFVTSLAAKKDDLEEESDVIQKTSEVGSRVESEKYQMVFAQHQSEAGFLEKEKPSVVCQQSRREGKTSENEQTDGMQSAEKLLAQPVPLNKGEACDQFKNCVAEVDSSSQPDMPVRRKRGRPPKKAKRLQQNEILKSPSSDVPIVQEVQKSSMIRVEEVEVSSANDTAKITSQTSSPVQSKESSSMITLSVKESRRCSFKKAKQSESQQPSLDIKEGVIRAPSTKVSSAVETQYTAPAESPQAPSVQPRERCTSVTLQDAMLLVEAMNQSMEENTHEAAGNLLIPTATNEAQPHINVVRPKQQHAVSLSNTTTSFIPPSTAPTQTSVQSLQQHRPHCLITPVASSRQSNTVPHRIILVQRSLLMPHNTASQTSAQLPTVMATVAVENNSTHPGPTVSDLPLKTPSSVPQKTAGLTLASKEPQSLSLLYPKVQIIIPRHKSPVTAKKNQSQNIHVTAQKSDNTSGCEKSPIQTAFVSETLNAHTETCPSLSIPVGLVPASVSSQTFEQKRTVVVRLNKLRFPISTKESVLVSEWPTNRCSDCLSILKEGSTHEKSSSVVISKQPSEMCPDFKETSLSVSVNTSRISEEPNDVQKKTSVSLENCTTLRESPTSGYVLTSAPSKELEQVFEKSTIAIHMTEPSAVSGIAGECTSDLDKEIRIAAQDCALPKEGPIEEKLSDALIHLTSITSKDTSDPHFQMTKTQFLAQLAVAPVTQDQKQVSSNDSVDTRLSCAETNISDKKRLQKTSLLAQLRSHVQTHLQAKRTGANPEPCTETQTETWTLSSKKPRLEGDHPYSKNATCDANLLCPNNPGAAEDVTFLKETTNDLTPISSRCFELYENDVNPSRTVSESSVSSSMSKATSEFTPVRPRRSNSDAAATLKVTTNYSLCPRRTSSTRDIVNSKMTKAGGSPYNTKTTPLRPNRTSLRRESASPKKTKSTSVSPRPSSLSKNGTSPNGVSSRKSKETTSVKKHRLSEDGTSPELRVVIAKLGKTGTTKTMAKNKNSNQSKVQNGAKTSQLAENPASCEALKKCTSKAVWTPPKIPTSKTPPAGGKRSGHSPIKTETVSPKSPDDTLVYPYSVSLHPIPVKAPPVVSPLQPLSVIGRHLLKNQCGECGRVLSSSAALESHVRLHASWRPFSCKLCGKGFTDSKGLKRHDRVHRNGRIHICQQCGKGFVYRFGLTKHLQSVHRRIKPYVCQICNKGFFTKMDVEAHIRMHTGERPFHCNLCDKKFTRRVELNVHLRWHNGEKRHWCPYCGKGFLDFNNMKRHKYIHTGEKPHSCPHCPKHFTQSGHLKKHVKNVHKIL